MFSLGDSHIYYLSREATDMRKGFDSLCGEVRRSLAAIHCRARSLSSITLHAHA